LSAEILEETGKKKKDGEGRPAKLYQYKKDAIAEIKTRRLFP
jgi:8-oxo-dGTP diphosphatase